MLGGSNNRNVRGRKEQIKAVACPRNQQYRKRRLTDRGGVFKYVLRLPAKGSYGTGSAISSRARRPAAERRATFPCKLRLAGGKLEQSASGDLRGRIGSRQALSARRLHRHQPIALGRAARPGGEPWQRGSATCPSSILDLWMPAKVKSGSSGPRGWTRSPD